MDQREHGPGSPGGSRHHPVGTVSQEEYQRDRAILMNAIAQLSEQVAIFTRGNVTPIRPPQQPETAPRQPRGEGETAARVREHCRATANTGSARELFGGYRGQERGFAHGNPSPSSGRVPDNSDSIGRDEEEEEDPSPFSDEIRWAPVPTGFREPHLTKFSGREDPAHHLQAFESAVALRNLTDELRCKLLATTFDGKARDWFYKLPPRSVRSFRDFRRELLQRFATSKKRKNGPHALFQIKQGPTETLGQYIDRFQEEILGIHDVDPTMYQVALVCGLQEGLFKFEVSRKPPGSYGELISMANHFIKGETTNPGFVSSLTQLINKQQGNMIPV